MSSPPSRRRLALIGPYPLFGHRSLEIYQKLLLEQMRAGTDFEVFDWTPPSPVFERHVPQPFKRVHVAERVFLLPPRQRRLPPVDVAHAASETAGFLLPASPATAKVCTFHDLADVDYVQKESAWRKLGRIYRQRNHRRTLAVADALATISGFTRDRLRALMGPVDAPIQVVHNPCRFADAAGPSDAARARARAHGPFFFHVGWLHRKNRPALLRAYARLRADRPAAPRLVLCGALAAEEARLLDELALGAAVVVLTDLDDDLLKAHYLEATAFVFPSLYEGFGLPVVEAQCFDTPVLAADIEILREVGGESCLFAPPTDVEALAAGMARLLDDAELRRGLIAAGRTNIRRFTLAAWTENYRTLYAIALERAAARRRDRRAPFAAQAASGSGRS